MSNFVKTPKQVEAVQIMSSNLHTMLYGGSRSGKTFITVRNIILRALARTSRHLICRFRFNHVKTSIWNDTLLKVLRICFPTLSVKFNKSDSFIEFWNGSQIWFGGFDDKERIDKILGNEYSTIYANECSEIAYDAITTALTRLAENSGLAPRFWYDCNPPSKKHWTYKVFIEGVDPLTKKPLDTRQYGYLLMNPTDNEENLPKGYIKNILSNLPPRKRTRFLDGLFQLDTDGAIWNLENIADAQLVNVQEVIKTIVAVDPAVTSEAGSDETGIVVVSLGRDKQTARVEADLSLKATPEQWAQVAVTAYYEFEASYIVAEVNMGGDLIESIIKNIDSTIKVKKVRASKGKFARAEPVQQLYEQKKIQHAPGLEELEEQLTEYVPHLSKKSPDRLDALVWGVTDLLIKQKTTLNARRV